MPHGYSKVIDRRDKVLYRKRHKNNEKTEIDIEPIPNNDKWFGFIDDDRGQKDLGEFATKTAAKTAAKNWMKQNPKGVSGSASGMGGGGIIPGMDGAQQSNDFFG